jgi:phosphodiesterase/alkaline phosphatase D-like protein
MTEAIRERACDWLVLGPVLGFTSQHSTRILAQPFDKHVGQLELRIIEAGANVRFEPGREGFAPLEAVGAMRRISPVRTGDFQTVLFEVDHLKPGTRYFYEIVPASAPTEIAGCFGSKQPFSFRTLPNDLSKFKFSFHSCNGLHKPPRQGRPTAMWGRLLREALEDPDLHFAILGGDQVYADVIREEWQREWEPDFDPYADAVRSSEDAARCREFFENLPRRYEQIYRAFWRRPEIRSFMGHIPCVMTWDDHDIYDGWGSYGNEELPAQQAFFRAAAQAFDAFQFVLAPPEPISSNAAANREGHRAFSFMVGDVAFVLLDLRSQRNIKARGPSAVLGEKQWAWLEAELDAIIERKAKQIVVISSIPVVHMGAEVEHLLPNAAEMHDDVLDHWSSRPNRSDQSRLLGKLFQVRKAIGANVLMLSGDVHVGTIASIVSTDKRFLLAGEDRAVIHQGVSSAIAYESVTGVSANAVRWLVLREHPLRGTFTGTVSEVVCERNFSVVSVQSNQAFRFTLFNEASEVPEQYYFGLES